jgi:drug/metabolite transporter (DMT)-like permease
MSQVLMAHSVLLLVTLFYGFNYFIAKNIFVEVSPFALIAIRGLGGLLFFSIVGLGFIREKVKREDIPQFALAGALGVGINQLLFLWGLSKTTEVNASVLMTMVPIFVLLVASLLKYERLTWLKATGIIISFLGALLLSLNGRSMVIGDHTLLGDAMVVFNTACYGSYLVLVRPLSRRYNPFTLIMGIFWFGSLITVPVGIPAIIHTDWLNVSTEAIWGIVFVIVCITWAAYGLNAWALKYVPSSQVGVYIYLQPVVVAILAPFLTDSGITIWQFFYMVLVMMGVYLVSRKKAPVFKHS